MMRFDRCGSQHQIWLDKFLADCIKNNHIWSCCRRVPCAARSSTSPAPPGSRPPPSTGCSTSAGVRGLTRDRVIAAARDRLPGRASAAVPTGGACAWTSSCRAAPTRSWTCSPATWRRRRHRSRKPTCTCTASTASAPRSWPRPCASCGPRAPASGSSPSTIPWCARRSARRGRRLAGPHHGVRHRAGAARRLRRDRQPCRGASGRAPARPLRAGLRGRGGPVRRLAQLPRPRGARDGLPPHPRRRVPEAPIVELREVRDDLERGYDEAKGLLAAHPGLRGIYNIGAGNRGIARALEEAGRGGEVVFIGHEITEHTRGSCSPARWTL